MILDQIAHFLIESPWFAIVGAGVLLIVFPKIMQRLRKLEASQDKEAEDDEKRREIMQATKFAHKLNDWYVISMIIGAIVWLLMPK